MMCLFSTEKEIRYKDYVRKGENLDKCKNIYVYNTCIKGGEQDTPIFL